MTKKQKNPSSKTRLCDKCKREIGVAGFSLHYKACNGDSNRPFGEAGRKYDRAQKAIQKKNETLESTNPGTVPREGPKKETLIATTVSPAEVPPTTMPEIHTTVPLNPTTNEHGGVIKGEQLFKEPPEDDEDTEDEWDGYLC